MGIQVFNYTLLHGQLISLAHRLATETPSRTSTPKMEVTAIGAIVLAAAALEAAVNHTIEGMFSPVTLSKDAFPLFYLARQHVEKLRPPTKRLEAAAYAGGFVVAWNEEPWNSARDLARLRNALIHYDAGPVQTSVEGRLFPHEGLKALAHRLDLWSIFEGGGTWLDVFCNRDCASWAVSTAEEAMRRLDQPPWVAPPPKPWWESMESKPDT